MKKNIFILLLITILIINFSFEYKVHAEAIAISSGLALFIKACYALGISYIGGEAVSRLTDDSIELYKEWQKFVNKQPPEKKPPTDWEKAGWLYLMGNSAYDSWKRLVDSVKDFFNDFGAKEGDNTLSLGDNVYHTPVGQPLKVGINVLFSGNSYSVITWSKHEGYQLLQTERQSYQSYGHKGFLFKNFSGSNIIITMIRTDGTTIDNAIASNIFSISNSVPPPIDNARTINYYYDYNSYQFTDNPDDIRSVYPDISNLPDGKVVKVINPDGSTSTYYKGSYDDLFNDWINSTDPNNMFGKKPINSTETDDGIKIDDNSDEMPYPNPQPEPETETSTALGKIVALLQQIVNWNKNIFDKIGKTPEKQPEPEPEPEPQPDPLELPQKVELDFSPLEGITLTDKFPFCLPWDLKRSINTLVQPPTPPRWEVELVTEKIVIDFEQFETLALISRSFFSITYVVTLIIITRRFISGA